jgi:hypothetical protein
MSRVVHLGIVVCLAAGGSSGVRAQETKSAAALQQTSPAREGPRISWTKSFDLAMKTMGADTKPVILYFTYDT